MVTFESVLDIHARKGIARIVAPVGNRLARIGITPSVVTVVGLAITITGAVFLALGWLAWGAIVGGFGALLDAVDGPLARLTGTESKRGALLDTVADRVGEIALWLGLGFYVAGDRQRVILCLAALATAMLIPYIRSKAEGWGAEGRGGIMGRAERLLLMLIPVGLEGLGLNLILPMLWTMTVLNTITVAIRAVRTWSQLAE